MSRLYALLAREAPKAVILRRGPSRQTCLIEWDLARDRFTVGQWLKARVFERRCDLSPSGDKLLYFASDYGRKPATWTAVSRVPYFTALLFWPKGDSWGGGGLFDGEKKIRLNHAANQMELGEGFRRPRGVSISPLGERSGAGEDAPLEFARRERDGWRFETQGKARWNWGSAAESVTFEEPQRFSRRSPVSEWTLIESLKARFVRNGPSYGTDYTLRSEAGEEVALGRLDWADWSQRGDLLFARDGRMLRLAIGKNTPEMSDAKELADFRDLKFESKSAPEEALSW